MKERELTGKVLATIRDDPRFASCAVEVKLARSATLHKGELKEHQYRALMLARHSAIYWKIADTSFVQLPFDGFVLKQAEAYVVIVYAIKPKREIWAIPIDNFPPDRGQFKLGQAREVGVRLD